MAELITPDAVWLIYFDDYDRRPEIIVGEAGARARFAQISDNWNAHLFVKVDSNSRDDQYAKANLPAGVPEVDLPGFDPRIRDALLHAETWIGSAPHGDNCYVSDHCEGDPGKRCNCGKESALSSIEQALECLATDGVGEDQRG